jgi:hypothetical protein
MSEALGPEPRPRLSRWALLGLWICGGWAMGLWVGPWARDALDEYRSRTTGPAYGLANDAASAIAAKLGRPERLAQLLGLDDDGFDGTGACSLSWTERESTHVFAQRRNRARTETAFSTVTVKGRSVLGRYAVDLWRGDCALRDGYPERPCTKVENVRLLERRELAVAPVPDGQPEPLLAGQCMWRTFGGESAVVGRYKVALPAEREITVRAYVLPATVFLSYRLSLAGHGGVQDAPLVRGENTVFRSIGEGEYELEVRVLPQAGVRPQSGEYTIQVHWGKGAGAPCPVPSFDERECYGAELPTPRNPDAGEAGVP